MPEETKIEYIVKKGAADAFRGDWYIEEKRFNKKSEAFENAMELTLANYYEFLLSWEEFGYEWSVFETNNGTEKKIWEGYAFIKKTFSDKNKIINQENGLI